MPPELMPTPSAHAPAQAIGTVVLIVVTRTRHCLSVVRTARHRVADRRSPASFGGQRPAAVRSCRTCVPRVAHPELLAGRVT